MQDYTLEFVFSEGAFDQRIVQTVRAKDEKNALRTFLSKMMTSFASWEYVDVDRIAFVDDS